MSLSVPTNPAELPAFRRRARRLVDTVSDLVRYKPHTYAAFQARVDADLPARDNGWDHFVDICLRQMLARDPHPYNAPDVQAWFAAGTVPFGLHLLNRLLRCLQDLGQLEDAQRGRPPMGSAGRPGYAAPGAFPMPPPPGLGPVPIPPFGAYHHHQLHLHHLLHRPVGFPMMQHHFLLQHVHPAAVPQLPVHLHHHHHLAAGPQHPVHIHHHHHHHRPHQHVEYPHPLPQQHPWPPQHSVPVLVVQVPAPGRGAQQQGVSQGEARGVPPGEARRMGAPAAAPPLAVPQPGLTAAGSSPRSVQVPDPAVPRGAPPVVPTGPEPVVPGGGPPPTRGMQGAAQHPVHLHHHHHHHRPHQHVEYPHPLPQQHPRPPQHTVPVPVPVPVPAPRRGAQQQGVSQGEARGVPPGEARRMGAPAAAPPLAVPQPGPTAAGSPPRTVQVPGPAVPRGAPPVVPTGPEPVVPGGGPPPMRGMQGAAPMGRPTSGEQAGDAAQEAAVAGPRDISELLAQALEEYRRTAAGSNGAAQEGADAGELIAQALAAIAPRAEGTKDKPSQAVASGGQDAGRGGLEAQTPAGGSGVVEPSGRRTKGEGVEDWMWEWREWRQVAPSEPCPAGLAYSMDLHAGTSWARLPANLRARLDAAEAAGGGGADERPLAPFPPRLGRPPAMVAAREGAEGEQEAEGEGDEEAYGPG